MKTRRMQAALRKENIGAAVIASLANTDPNLFYFTGMELGGSFLIIPKKGNSFLMVSKMEYERAKLYSNVGRVERYEKPALGSLARALSRHRTIGINKNVISLNEHRAMKRHLKKKYRDISEILLTVRRKKEPGEIRKLKKACMATDRVFARLLGNFSFRTERQVEQFIENEARRLGLRLSFPPIVASGKNSSMPHYRAAKSRLGKGFLLIDFGLEYEGYKADMTRTIHLGSPGIKERAAYSALLAVQRKAISAAGPGVRIAHLCRLVRGWLGRYSENFIHSLGHGIGVQIHELPSLHEESKDSLADRDIFTIEPGIYLEGKFGIRIEDDILLEGKRKTVLTKSTRELVCI